MQFTSAHITVLDHGPWWHFTSDPVTEAQLVAEEMFQLGYVRLESWRWLDKIVVRYRPTKLGRSELRKYRKDLDKKFALIFANLDAPRSSNGRTKGSEP